MSNKFLEISTDPKEYVAFDAMSLRNLIIDRLNNEGLITDQNYIGSNISSIIDIVCYSFNTLIYYLNKTSTESMFSEAQLFENINRIVKILDYKPIGFQTSLLPVGCRSTSAFAKGVYTIPRYSYINVNGVIYSFNEDVSFNIPENFFNDTIQDLTNKKLLYQGIYRETPKYIATGDVNEVVKVQPINGNIDHFNIDVYVYEADYSKWVKYKEISNFFEQTGNERVHEKRLNSDLSYDITFGDDVRGRQLKKNDIVVIFYLESTGAVENVNVNSDLGLLKLFETPTLTEILSSTVEKKYISQTQTISLRFYKTYGSTSAKNIQTVDEIRKAAPQLYKSQFRLVTKDDYQSYISHEFSRFVKQVTVFNNWDYMSKYIKYFYDINITPSGFEQIMLNQVSFADACNFNNIYICAVPRTAKTSAVKYLFPSQKETILNSVNSIKTITSEVSFVDPVYKTITFGFKTDDTIPIQNKEDFVLEVITNDASLRSKNSIAAEVAEIIKTMFDPSNIELGQTINIKNLEYLILSLQGVSSLRTKNTVTNEYINGISFFMWNSTYPDADKQTIQNNVTLSDFMFLYFDNLDNAHSKILIS